MRATIKAVLDSGVEDGIIREKRSEGWAWWRIAEYLSRLRGRRYGEDNVRRRGRHMDQSQCDAPLTGKPAVVKRKWEPTPDDDDMIRLAWAGELTLATLRRHMGVTDHELYNRARELELGKKITYQADKSKITAIGGQVFASYREFEEWQGKLYAGRRYDGRKAGVVGNVGGTDGKGSS